MTELLDLMARPVLGRLHGINRKHRFRAKHYADIGDWPEKATFDVLDASELEKRDHLASTDAMLVVSDKLKTVLAACAPSAQFFEADAGGTRVWVVPPPEDDDVMYEADGTPEYAEGGYQVTHATRLHVDETPESPWCKVRNTSIIALSDALVAAAKNAAIRWEPVKTIAKYAPHTPHPYVLVRSQGGDVETLELIGEWPVAPKHVPHPLHDWVRDEEFEKPDVDAAWSSLVHQKEVARAVIARFCSGLPLPKLRAELDKDIAKSKLKKRWKEATTASGMSCKGLFVVASKWKDMLGSSCKYTPIELRDPVLKEKHEGFFVVEPPAASFIDLARSDVAFMWSGMIDGYLGLHPTPESYTATQPIVRATGTNLILVHRDLAAKLDGFYTKPLHEMSFGLNLDDFWRVD